MSDVKSVFQTWLDNTVDALKDSYDNEIKTGSGKWKQSLSNDLKQDNNIYTGTISANDYSNYMEYGRGPTKTKTAGNPTLYEIIREWIDDRGIIPKNPKTSRDSLAYAITQHIHKNGTKGKNIISPVLTEKRINDLFEDIKNEVGKNARNFVSKEISELYKLRPKK